MRRKYAVVAGQLIALQTWGQLSFWTPENGLPGFARENSCSFVIGDTAYVCGGTNAFLSQSTSALYAYHEPSGVWVPRTSHPQPVVVAASAFAVAGKGYVLGGNVWNWMNVLYSYDPADGSWTQRASHPNTQQVHGFGFGANGKGYLITTMPDSVVVWEYDPLADGWTQRTSLHLNGPSLTTQFSVGGMAYVGHSSGALFRYDPMFDTWTTRATCPFQTNSWYGFELAGMGYVTGGYSANPPSAEVYRYDVGADAWYPDLTFIGPPRINTTSFSVAGKGFICGGVGGVPTTYYADMWSASPLSTTVSDAALTIGTRCSTDPAGDQLAIHRNDKGDFAYRIMDALGKVILNATGTGTHTFVPILDLGVGVYILVVEDAVGTYTTKFVKR